MDDDRELLLELVTSAWRPTDLDGAPRSHPAWHDLDPADRREAYERTVRQRRIEAALDPAGLTTTAKQIMARIRGS
jgi:hypothetical protein